MSLISPNELTGRMEITCANIYSLENVTCPKSVIIALLMSPVNLPNKSFYKHGHSGGDRFLMKMLLRRIL